MKLLLLKKFKVTLNQIKPDFIVKVLSFRIKLMKSLKLLKDKCQLVFSSGEVNLSINENEYKKENLFNIQVIFYVIK